MGVDFSSHNLYASRGDKQAVVRYLRNPEKDNALDDLWRRFDKDGSGTIERAELEQLVFHILVAFWEEYLPHRDVPKKDSFRPVIDKVVTDILLQVDDDDNQEISREEWVLFGRYLQQEWNVVQQKKVIRERQIEAMKKQASNRELEHMRSASDPIPEHEMHDPLLEHSASHDHHH